MKFSLLLSSLFISAALCSSSVRTLVKPTSASFQKNLKTFKKLALYKEPLLDRMEANYRCQWIDASQKKELCRAQWIVASHKIDTRIGFMMKLLENCCEEQDKNWVHYNVQDAKASGIDFKTIKYELLPYLKDLSEFLKDNGKEMRHDLSALKYELFLEYHAHLFQQLTKHWSRLDDQGKTEFRAEANQHFLTRIVPEASYAYFLVSLPTKITFFDNKENFEIFSGCVINAKACLTTLMARAPDSKEIEKLLGVYLNEAASNHGLPKNKFMKGLNYFLEVMQLAEDITGRNVESNLENGGSNCKPHLE